MPHLLKTGLLLTSCVALSLALTACKTTTVNRDVRVISPDVPADLLDCAVRPDKPFGQFTQKDVSRYLVKLEDAHADCKGNLGAVKKIVTEFKQKVPTK